MKTTLSIIAITLLALAPVAHAEGARVDVTPSLGYFNPTQNNLDEVIPGIGTVEAKHGSGTAFGGRLTVWFNETFGIEGTAYYTGSSLDGQAFGAAGSVDASLYYWTGRAVLGFGHTTRFVMSAGMGQQLSSYDTPGIENGAIGVGVVGAGLQIPMGTSTALSLNIDDYMYKMYWEFDGLRSTEQNQHDVVMAVGITFQTGR